MAERKSSLHPMAKGQLMTPVATPPHPYPGLDYEEVLENMSGDTALLTQLARLFLEQHAVDLIIIEAALREQNWDLALHLTHALRGTAGNIGGLAVYDAAQRLENVLGARLDEPVTVPADLKAAMSELVTSLQLLIQDPPSAY
ncbi:MAG: Hpt domain-containing protein [Candidatus Krumholzibacteria bacterium]|nr:Hpt domain-containing protein [Candidatus Krumholzibacteria bacterium]